MWEWHYIQEPLLSTSQSVAERYSVPVGTHEGEEGETQDRQVLLLYSLVGRAGRGHAGQQRSREGGRRAEEVRVTGRPNAAENSTLGRQFPVRNCLVVGAFNRSWPTAPSSPCSASYLHRSQPPYPGALPSSEELRAHEGGCTSDLNKRFGNLLFK